MKKNILIAIIAFYSSILFTSSIAQQAPGYFTIDTLESAMPVADSSLQLDISIYPNPASNIMTVRYYVPETNVIIIRMYDTKGRRNKTLFNGENGSRLA